MFRIGDLLAASFEDLDIESFDIELLDHSARQGADRLYAAEDPAMEVMSMTPQWSFLIEFAGRRWRLGLSPSAVGLTATTKGVEWPIVLVGAFVAALLVFIVLTVSGREIELSNLIADRTAALEQARRMAEKRRLELQTLMDHSPTVVMLKGLDGKLLTINREYERVFGVASPDHREQTVHDFLPPEVAQSADRHDRQVLTTGRPHVSEFKYVVNGAERVFFSIKFPVFDAHEEPMAVGLTMFDITELRETREALDRSEAIFTSLVRNSPAWVSARERAGGQRRLEA